MLIKIYIIIQLHPILIIFHCLPKRFYVFKNYLTRTIKRINFYFIITIAINY